MHRVGQRNREDAPHEITLELFSQLKCHDTAVAVCHDGNVTSLGPLLHQ